MGPRHRLARQRQPRRERMVSTAHVVTRASRPRGCGCGSGGGGGPPCSGGWPGGRSAAGNAGEVSARAVSTTWPSATNGVSGV
eukprot:6947773-Pyramimonas_sp.AAC.1